MLGSDNLPTKSNFQGLRGFDALTGKSNFDIAEWMLIRLIEAMKPTGAIAMLCKTMTARKVLRHLWKIGEGFADTSLYLIDAKRHFNVSVDACLFYTLGKRIPDRSARVYSGIDNPREISHFGLIDGHLVSDIAGFVKHKELAGGSTYIWRSGVKHDATEIMELERSNGHFRNGLGETADLESHCVYPLLKSSDLGNGRSIARKYVLVTQSAPNESTDDLREIAPRTWQYLEAHAAHLDTRRSSIYEKRARFSIFGIGPYSFAPWKVAISGLCKNIRFVVVPPHDGRPVMVDDTCYFIPCSNQKEAVLLCELLSSKDCKEFLSSLVFDDSKRPITSEVLRRISLFSLASRLNRVEEFVSYAQGLDSDGLDSNGQMSLAMDRKPVCRVARTQRSKKPERLSTVVCSIQG